MYISRRFSLKPIHWPPANHGSALQIYLSFCKWSLEHPWTSFLVLKTSQNPRDSRLSGNPGAVTKKTKEALIKTQDSLEELWDSRHQPGISERKWTTEGVQWGFLHKMPPPEVGTGLDQFGTYDGTMGTMGPWKKKLRKPELVDYIINIHGFRFPMGIIPSFFRREDLTEDLTEARWSQLSWRTWQLLEGESEA